MKSNKMKAVIYTKYGSPEVLELKEVEKPTPKDDEILIKIFAATVTAGDCELRSFKIPILFWLPVRLYMGILKPRIKILGQELSGEIESVGKDVTQYKKGDNIFAATDMNLGAYAEYICLSSKNPIAIKPENMTFDEAATIPTGGLNSLHFLKKGNIKAGEKVLINGAAGSIGTYAIQIAKSLGADVTAVDSRNKLDILLSIGADHVIDYTCEDFTKNGKTYDVIFDIVGKSSFNRSVKSLNPKGRYLLANPSFSQMIRGKWTSIIKKKKVISGMASYKTKDLNNLKELIETGKLKSVIDKRFPLEEIVEAHRYVEKGDKKGNVVITV